MPGWNFSVEVWRVPPLAVRWTRGHALRPQDRPPPSRLRHPALRVEVRIRKPGQSGQNHRDLLRATPQAGLLHVKALPMVLFSGRNTKFNLLQPDAKKGE